MIFFSSLKGTYYHTLSNQYLWFGVYIAATNYREDWCTPRNTGNHATCNNTTFCFLRALSSLNLRIILFFFPFWYISLILFLLPDIWQHKVFFLPDTLHTNRKHLLDNHSLIKHRSDILWTHCIWHTFCCFIYRNIGSIARLSLFFFYLFCLLN